MDLGKKMKTTMSWIQQVVHKRSSLQRSKCQSERWKKRKSTFMILRIKKLIYRDRTKTSTITVETTVNPVPKIKNLNKHPKSDESKQKTEKPQRNNSTLNAAIQTTTTEHLPLFKKQLLRYTKCGYLLVCN
jgi:hypothetical protein